MNDFASRILTLVAAAAAALLVSCSDGTGGKGAPGAPQELVLRIGHFPNVTHAHGLVAHATTRAGDGWLEKRLGPGVRIEWYTYNAGPSAMEALIAGSLDVTYVGPSPALNAHLRSKGTDIRVLAGATRGGAALVVQGDGRIKTPADFRGRRVATPQLGNTQDVACRAWLKAAGFSVTLTGGDVTVVPTENPTQLALFQKGELDAVWTVEPWVSRLEREGGGKVLVSEDDTVTTVLACSAKFVRERPLVAAKLAELQGELTTWLAAHEDEAKRLVRAELKAETGQEMAEALLDGCWRRMRFDARVTTADFAGFLAAAQSAGFLTDAGDIHQLVLARM